MGGESEDRHDPGRGAEGAIDPGPLAATVGRGALISAVTLGLTQIISLVSTIWLARLLTPSEVGIYTASTVLSAILVSFSGGGLRLALIQRERDVDDAADTVFWATAAVGVCSSVAALAAAPVLGRIFHNDLVTAVAMSTSGLLLLESLTQVPDGLMQRRFNFLRRLVVDPSRAIAYSAVAIALAAAGFGVWSMVLGQYAAVIVWLIGSWTLGRWRPGRGRPSLRLWRELARFAYPVAIANLVGYARETAEITIVGRVLGEASLGNYRYGTRLGMLPGNAVFEIGSYVLFPAFSRLATDTYRLQAAFLRALRWIWFAAAPAAALVIGLGEQAVLVVLGQPWRAAGVLLVALSGAGLGLALQAVANEAIKAVGRSALLNWTSAIEILLGIGLVVALLPLGLFGVGLAISATEIVSAVVLLTLARPIIGFRFAAIIGILTPPAIAAAVGLGAVLALIRVFGSPVTLPTTSGLGALTALALSLLVVYLATLAVLDRSFTSGLLTRFASRP